MNSPLLGIDLGKQRTGLAISENGVYASPLSVLENRRPHTSYLVRELLQAIQDKGIATAVVGLPLTSEEEETLQSLWCRRVVEELRQSLPTSVTLETFDEFGTTLEGTELFPDGTPGDAAAAAVLLQRYIDAHAQPVA